MSYYENVNYDLLKLIPFNAKSILEIGCGSGSLAGAYKKINPNVKYTGVELFSEVALIARNNIDIVVNGDIEDENVFNELILQSAGIKYDVVVFGDVLEHLRNPKAIVKKINLLISENSICAICVPNVSHWSIIISQLKGRWDYENSGLLDKTHIHFFTLQTAIEMMQIAGWQFEDARPRILWPEKTKKYIDIISKLSENLEVNEDLLKQNLSAYQWLIRTRKGVSSTKLSVVALSMAKVAGVTEARIDYPLSALNSLPSIRALWSENGLSIPKSFNPGILILHRQFIDSLEFRIQLESLINKGWLIVSEIDDDPRNWKQFVDTDFYAFKGVHAVSVSTERIKNLIYQWNPNIKILPNQIYSLNALNLETPKNGEKLKIFFGALNRKKDWESIENQIKKICKDLKDTIEFVVIHDKEFFDMLPDFILKTYYPTLKHAEYNLILEKCDIALLPLLSNSFNELKSDLKFIECCAAGVVPICSEIVYSENHEHRKIGVFPISLEHWASEVIALCNNKDEIINRKKLGYEYVKKERLHSIHVCERESWYRSLIDNKLNLENQRKLRLLNILKPSSLS